MSISTPLVALPGPIRQIGFVVSDLDKALESWVALGVGPWYVIRGQHLHTLYRGEPCQVTLTIALANSGDMQLEVIAQEGGDPSIYTEFLSSGREDSTSSPTGQPISMQQCSPQRLPGGR